MPRQPAPALAPESTRAMAGAAARLASRHRGALTLGWAAMAAAAVLLLAPPAAADLLQEAPCSPAAAVSDRADEEASWLCGFSEPPGPADQAEPISPLAVPICLIEGASGIAPLLVHALDGARIVAGPSCDDAAPALRAAVVGDGDDLPGRGGDSKWDAAVRTSALVVPLLWAPMPGGSLRAPPDAPLPGFVPRVYRPPRG